LIQEGTQGCAIKMHGVLPTMNLGQRNPRQFGPDAQGDLPGHRAAGHEYRRFFAKEIGRFRLKV
jgi:hypothetical protein